MLIFLETELPWTDCDNHWNTYECLTADEMSNKTYLAWYLKGNFTRQNIIISQEGNIMFYIKQLL